MAESYGRRHSPGEDKKRDPMKALYQLSKSLLISMALCCLLLSAIASPAHAFLYEYIDILPPGWQDASTEYFGYFNKSPIK